MVCPTSTLVDDKTWAFGKGYKCSATDQTNLLLVNQYILGRILYVLSEIANFGWDMADSQLLF